ncbi:MAG: hypothetical protein ABIG36_10305 [Pseudomonadota bacterium]
MATNLYGIVTTAIGSTFYVLGLVAMKRPRRFIEEPMPSKPGGCFTIGFFVFTSLFFALSLLGIHSYFFTVSDMREFPYVIYPSLFCPISFFFWLSVRSEKRHLEHGEKNAEHKH